MTGILEVEFVAVSVAFAAVTAIGFAVAGALAAVRRCARALRG